MQSVACRATGAYKLAIRGRVEAARVSATQPHRIINRCKLPVFATTHTNRCQLRTDATCRLYPSRSKSRLTVVKGR